MLFRHIKTRETCAFGAMQVTLKEREHVTNQGMMWLDLIKHTLIIFSISFSFVKIELQKALLTWEKTGEEIVHLELTAKGLYPKVPDMIRKLEKKIQLNPNFLRFNKTSGRTNVKSRLLSSSKNIFYTDQMGSRTTRILLDLQTNWCMYLLYLHTM